MRKFNIYSSSGDMDQMVGQLTFEKNGEVVAEMFQPMAQLTLSRLIERNNGGKTKFDSVDDFFQKVPMFEYNLVWEEGEDGREFTTILQIDERGEPTGKKVRQFKFVPGENNPDEIIEPKAKKSLQNDSIEEQFKEFKRMLGEEQ